MKKLIAILLCTALCFGLTACGGGGSGSSAAPSGDSGTAPSDSAAPPAANAMVLKLGHVGPPGSTMDIVANGIAAEIAEKSGGAISIEVYPQSQLGDETVMLDSCVTGTLEMAMIGAPVMSTVFSEFNALCLPFLFRSTDEFFAVVQDPEFIAKSNAVTNTKGIELIGYPNGEMRGFSNVKREVRTPDDIKGLKIRVMNGSIYTDTFSALGVTTSTMPFGEVYTALQQGVIDGEDNGLDFMTKQKFTEVEKFHTNLGHAIQTNPFIVSSEVWARFTPGQQEIIRSAVKSQMDAYPVTLKTEIEKAVSVAGEEGVALVMDLSDEEYRAFFDTMTSVYDKYVPLIGDDFYKFTTDKIEAYRSK